MGTKEGKKYKFHVPTPESACAVLCLVAQSCPTVRPHGL